MEKILYIIIAMTLGMGTYAQTKNTYEEVMPFRELGGKIVIRASVGGEEGNFILDSRGGLILFPEAAAKRGIVADESKVARYSRKSFKVLGGAVAETIFIGENIYQRDVPLTVIEKPLEWKELEIDGLIGITLFQNVVMTINAKDKTMTTSFPYRPEYMKLGNRNGAELTPEGLRCDVVVDGQDIAVGVDLLEDNLFVLGDAEKGRFTAAKKNITVAKEMLHDVPVVAGEYTILGLPLLAHGAFAIDLAKQKYYFQAYGQGENQVSSLNKADEPKSDLVVMDRPMFLKEVWNYRENKEWKYEGKQPMIVDFWASWCDPCMRMLPVMEEMAVKYKGKVIFAKVNVDREKELRDVFKIQGIPYLLFITADGKLSTEMRAYAAPELEKLIEERLLPGK